MSLRWTLKGYEYQHHHPVVVETFTCPSQAPVTRLTGRLTLDRKILYFEYVAIHLVDR